jgi:hypothetical protein
VKEGESLGVSGTPTIFVNGQMLDGARPVGDFRALFDGALQQAGVPPPAHAGSPASAITAPPAASPAAQR